MAFKLLEGKKPVDQCPGVCGADRASYADDDGGTQDRVIGLPVRGRLPEAMGADSGTSLCPQAPHHWKNNTHTTKKSKRSMG